MIQENKYGNYKKNHNVYIIIRCILRVYMDRVFEYCSRLARKKLMVGTNIFNDFIISNHTRI